MERTIMIYDKGLKLPSKMNSIFLPAVLNMFGFFLYLCICMKSFLQLFFVLIPLPFILKYDSIKSTYSRHLCIFCIKWLIVTEGRVLSENIERRIACTNKISSNFHLTLSLWDIHYFWALPPPQHGLEIMTFGTNSPSIEMRPN